MRCVWISHGEERCGGDEAHKVSVVSCADSVAYPRAVVVEIPDAVPLTEIRGRESAQGMPGGVFAQREKAEQRTGKQRRKLKTQNGGIKNDEEDGR